MAGEQFDPNKFKNDLSKTGGVNTGAPVVASAQGQGLGHQPLPVNQQGQKPWVNPLGPLEESKPGPTGEPAPVTPVQPEGTQPPAPETPPTPPTTSFEFKLQESQGKKLLEAFDVQNAADFSFDAMINKIEGLKKRDTEMTQMLLDHGVYQSEKLTELSGLKAKSDEDIVKWGLKENGFTDEEITEQLKVYEDNENIDVQAKVFRKQVERQEEAEKLKLKGEREAEINKRKQEADGSMSEEARQKRLTEFEERLKGVDTMNGVKLGKDEAELAQKRKELAQQAANGDMIREILADPEVYLSAVHLLKNKQTVLSVVRTQGVETGKETILNHIQHPERPITDKSPLEPGAVEFNPTKWNQDVKASTAN